MLHLEEFSSRMALSKQIELTQAIIDGNDIKVEALVKHKNVNNWININVPKSALRNHRLPHVI